MITARKAIHYRTKNRREPPTDSARKQHYGGRVFYTPHSLSFSLMVLRNANLSTFNERSQLSRRHSIHTQVGLASNVTGQRKKLQFTVLQAYMSKHDDRRHTARTPPAHRAPAKHRHSTTKTARRTTNYLPGANSTIYMSKRKPHASARGTLACSPLAYDSSSTNQQMIRCRRRR